MSEPTAVRAPGYTGSLGTNQLTPRDETRTGHHNCSGNTNTLLVIIIILFNLTIDLVVFYNKTIQSDVKISIKIFKLKGEHKHIHIQ